MKSNPARNKLKRLGAAVGAIRGIGLRVRVNSRAFTLVEMIVILGVISLLTASLIVYSRKSEQQIALFREGARFFGFLTRAKSLALGTYGGEGVPCGYGIHFEPPRTAILFKDLSDDCKASSHTYSGDLEKVESLVLDSRTEFKDVMATDILFMPPDLKVFIVPDAQSALIGIGIFGGVSKTNIRLTKAGQITME